jgi:hypothetical protein
MTDRKYQTSVGKAAVVAGIGLLLMMIPAIFANFAVVEGLIVPGDAATTASNIADNATLFRLGIGCFMIVAILDLLVTWALYIVLKPVNKSLSLLAAWGRLVYTTILAVALPFLVTALRLVEDAGYQAALGAEGLQAQVLLSAGAFNDVWAFGYLFFALHLLLIGYLAFKSGYIPKILGILVMVSSFSYLIDNVARLLLPAYGDYTAVFMILLVPAFLGEPLLAVWLLIRGRKLPG